MKKFATAAAFVGLFLAAAPGNAQTFGFGAHAGVSIPTGDYADAVTTGFSGGVDLTYPLLMITPGLNWYTSADVVAHSADDEGFVDVVDGGFLYIPVMTGLQFVLPGIGFRPFVNAQGGLVLHKGPTIAGIDSEMGTDFGFSVGGGARLGQNFYAGVKYYPLSPTFKYEGDAELEMDANFLDIFVGFGVF